MDLNIEIANAFTRKIETSEAVSAVRGGLSSMDALYFDRQRSLSEAARRSSGNWTLEDGYQPDGLNFRSSNSIRSHLDAQPPYAEFVERRLVGLLGDIRPKVVGLTITIPQQLYGALWIAKLLKKLDSNHVVALGGNLPTRLFDEMSLSWMFDIADVLITNQGEQALVELARSPEDRSRWSSIPNVRYRDQGEVISSRRQLLSPSEFCQPDFSDTSFASYWATPYAPVIGARGCYYGKCTFCAIPFAWGNGGYIGSDNPRNVVRTMIDTVDRFQINRFKFVEESLHPKLVGEISQLLIDEGASVEWEGYARMDAPWFDSRFLQTVARAGLRKLYVGLELLPGTNREVFQKKDTPAALEFLTRMKEAGILVHIFVLVGHPGTSIDDAVSTLNFAMEHQDLIDTLDINGFRYEKHTVIPGVTRRPDVQHDWALDDPFETGLHPSLRPEAIDRIEDMLFKTYRDIVPRWFHPIYYAISPWTAFRKSSNNSEALSVI